MKNTIRHTAFGLFAIGSALLFSGCAGTTHNLEGFHDATLLEGAQTTSLDSSGLAKLSENMSNEGLTKTATLSSKGAVYFLRAEPGARGAGTDGGYEEVSVKSSAQNVKWEIWTREKALIGTPGAYKKIAGENFDYKKIYGPFKAGESVKVELEPQIGGGYVQRILMIVAYSPSDPGSEVTLTLGPVVRR